MIDILDTVKYVPCHPKNCGGPRRADWIKFLVFHYTGNDGDTGANNAKYYQNNVVQASAHYFVDDETITQSVKDLTVAFAVGGKKWSDTGKTGGGTMYGIVTNNNSISIELCDTQRDGQLMATQATLDRGIRLGRALMEKYHIPIENVVRHFDVTGKHCPAYFMDKDAWVAFKARLTAPAEPEQREILCLYRTLDQLPAWARPSAEKAVLTGLMKRDTQGLVTLWEPNLQPLVWLDRLGLLDKPQTDEQGGV